jgi:hypothetical protein
LKSIQARVFGLWAYQGAMNAPIASPTLLGHRLELYRQQSVTIVEDYVETVGVDGRKVDSKIVSAGSSGNREVVYEARRENIFSAAALCRI